MINIVEYIPTGEKNAVSRAYLRAATGLTDRTVRSLIEAARRKQPILNFQGGGGYFLPAENEGHLVEKWRRQEMHRAGTIMEGVNGANMFYVK